MSKFNVYPCLKNGLSDNNGYKGPVITLVSSSDESFVLFFPVSEYHAGMINFFLQNNKKDYDCDTKEVGVYKTIIDSWNAGERYLSGVLMDIDNSSEEEYIIVQLVISNEDGKIDSVVRANFTHGIILAAIERVEIIISDKMLSKIIPPEDESSDGSDDEEDKIKDKSKDKVKNKDNQQMPVDQNILEIARRIMSGKIE